MALDHIQITNAKPWDKGPMAHLVRGTTGQHSFYHIMRVALAGSAAE